MKKYKFTVLVALVVLLSGFQTAYSQTGSVTDRGNAAPAAALPDELQGVDVKDYFVDAYLQPAGHVRTVVGHVVVFHEDTGQAFFAAPGDAVCSRDTIYTLADSRCRIRFVADDIITMGENTRIGIEEYLHDREEKKKTSIFSMLRGKAMFYAMRLFKYRSRSSSVRTPTAVVGVRGTKFGVEVRKIGEEVAQSSVVYVADASGSGLKYLLAQSVPQDVVTTTHCFDGEIVNTALADGKTSELGMGESQNITGLGLEPAFGTPPEMGMQFQSDVKAGGPAEPEEDKKEEDTTQKDLVQDTGGEPAKEETPDPTQKLTNEDNVQDAVEEGVIPNPDAAVPQWSGPAIGYFANMVTHQGYAYGVDNVYVSNAPQDFDSAQVRAEGLYSYPPYTAFVDGMPGSSFTDPHLKQVSIDGTPITTSADNLGFPVTTGILGYNQYQVWGYWYVAEPFVIEGWSQDFALHDLRHKGWYIFGEPTPDVSGISGNYFGPAYGTFWDPNIGAATGPQGIDMAGFFECFVDGPNAQIKDFNLVVLSDQVSPSYPGYMAGLLTDTGAVSGSMSGGSFKIDNPNTVQGFIIMPGPEYAGALYQSAAGSLYGPNGENIGGAWGVKAERYVPPNYPYVGAAGIFMGYPGTGAVPPVPQ